MNTFIVTARIADLYSCNIELHLRMIVPRSSKKFIEPFLEVTWIGWLIVQIETKDAVQ